jgi:hypothetical protein
MAEVKVIEVQIKSNLDNSTASVSKFKSGLKEATTQSKELSSSLQGSKESEFINKLGEGVGKLNPAFGSAIQGANGLLVKMWALVANPIGAILAAITVTLKFLYEAFESSVAGGKELKTIFTAISAVGDQVKDAMFGLGRALISTTTAAYKFITLDFKGAAEDMKKANGEATTSYKQLGSAVDGTTFKIIKNLEKQQQANDKARKIQAVTQSETNKLLVQSREILTDETASIQEKKKALEQVTKAEKESSAEKVRIAAEDLRIAKDAAQQKGGQIEAKSKQKLRELTIALNEAETENAMTGIKLNKQKKMLGRQEVADAQEKKAALKTISDQNKAAAKVAYDQDKTALEERLREEGLNFQQRRDLIKQDKILNQADRKKLNDQINKEEQKTIDDHNKAIADLNKKYDDEKLNRLADTAVKKEELDYTRQVAEIEKLAQTELEKQTLIEKLDAEHKVRMGTAQKTDAEKQIADAKAKADKQIEIDKSVADAKKSIQESQFNNISAGIGLLKGLFEKNKGVQKALLIAESAAGIAKIIINTQAANSAAKLKYALLPGGQALSAAEIVMNKVSAGIGIASNIAATAKGLSALGGGGSASSSSVGGSEGGSAAPAFNVVGASATNQLAQTLGNKEQQPVKAYVVSNDVTTAQSLDRNIIQSASIG